MGAPTPIIVASAAVMGASLPVGWALARVASRFASPSTIKSRWLIVGAAFVSASALIPYWRPDGSIRVLAISVLLGAALLVLAAVDIAAWRLPDAVTLPIAWAGLALADGQPFMDRLVGLIAGIAAIAGFNALYVRLRGRAGIGLGDAKLFGLAGAWLGWRALPSVLLLACAGGLVWAALRLLIGGRRTLVQPIAFGAPISLAIWSVWLSV